MLDPQLMNSQRIARPAIGQPAGQGYGDNIYAQPAGNQYGYGQTPGSGPGYYEQQTPVGSYVGADYTGAAVRPDSAAMYASNPYLGMSASTAGPAGRVGDMGAAAYGAGANPYLGQRTERVAAAGANPYGMGNPYLQEQINATTADASKAWNNTVNPQFDRMAAASGSFGNTGVEQARGQAMGDFGRNLSTTIGGMRMQDYTQQQNLAENALNREQAVNMANAGFNAGDLSRDASGYLQGKGLGLQGLGMSIGANQFDSNLGANLGMFNAGQVNNMGQFNAGQYGNMSMFNAGQGNNMSQFNQGQGNNLGMFNAGQRNDMNRYNASAGNAMLENYRNRYEQGRQFDQNLDWNIDQGNWNRQRTGMQDALDIYDRMNANTSDAYNMGDILNKIPADQQKGFTDLLTKLGGMGVTDEQKSQLFGNPALGAIGGWQAIAKLLEG